ncbi:hypothetical protein [Lewinella cohaerens]|uniref:hypothetical protein n=1 Tax=Lewinella cohaerens TaxID=70995 RepID=UPI000366CCC5|nr:hypothetical protein [Lewinella cohaerens]
MSDSTLTILKDPQLPPAEDYRALRAEGFSAVQELGNEQWTDYNAHDPGITLMEALAYTISELGYRTGFDIADILTERSGYISFRQALFTARRILTNNPVTVNDFRKSLIDLPRLRNAWLLCKECACETTVYAECKDSQLYHAPQWRLLPKNLTAGGHEHPVFVKGLYEVLLQLEVDAELGDLNNRKLIQTLNIDIGEPDLAALTIEIRFPDWSKEQPELYAAFISTDPSFMLEVDSDNTLNEGQPTDEGIRVTRFSRDRTTTEEVTTANQGLLQGWRNVFYLDLVIPFQVNGDSHSLELNSVPVRFFSPREGVKRVLNVEDLKSFVFENAAAGGLVDRYRRKLQAVEVAVGEARHQLHQLRNLGEDYCRVQGIQTEDVAFCADVELTPDADIEFVLANIFYLIETHFNPKVPFHTLSELTAEGLATEDIFIGPALENGFIKEEDLEAAQLRSVIHISDLYNKLMDIPGVIAIQQVQFTRYDDEGNPIMPSHSWSIPVRALHIAQLYQEASRVLFYKNGLPFLARMDEVRAILAQLRSADIGGKLPLAERDFPIPVGVHRDLSSYEPVQHTLPLTYGIGTVGLPPRATDARRSQAHQLKGYLLPFEQLLADMTKQLAHTPDLFSTDETVDRTYFSHFFDAAAVPTEIADYSDLVTAQATEDNLRGITESAAVFQDRRNRFLDHLLARFGEQFRDYALMLHANEDRIPFAADKLIRDKIRFLRFYPRISADRGRAFNYRYDGRWCDPRNQAGISDRISRLLGMETLRAYFAVEITNNQGVFEASFTLNDTRVGGAGLLLEEVDVITATTGEAAEDLTWALIGDIIANSTTLGRYGTDGNGDPILEDENGLPLAMLATGVVAADVIAFTTDILAKERLFPVEHLLLRPVFPGSPLMPVCLPDDCTHCGEEDPYSFRLTYVLQGSLAPFSYDIDLRQFADQTIRRETPSYLLPKICWVGNRTVEKDECAPIFSQLSNVLLPFFGAEQEAAACSCAVELYDGFDALFQPWMASRLLTYRPYAAWAQDLRILFADLASADFPCLGTDEAWDTLHDLLLDHFVTLAVQAHQFDRFEIAWCNWLEANSPFLWQPLNAQLQRQTELWLQSTTGQENNCQCAELLLAYFGDRFRNWISSLVEEEADLADIPSLASRIDAEVWQPFRSDLTTALTNDPSFCPLQGLDANDERWEDLLQRWLAYYSEWIAVAYRHEVLLRIFSDLTSIYPTATLHDCDDGSDDNPVRLDNTILGTL